MTTSGQTPQSILSFLPISKFGVSSNDAMLKQIKIVDTSGRPLLLFTPFEPADLTNFLSAAQMSTLMPYEREAEENYSTVSTRSDPDTPVTDSPTALVLPQAPIAPEDGDLSAKDLSIAVAASDPKEEAGVVELADSEPASAPPALHPNAVAGALFSLHLQPFF